VFIDFPCRLSPMRENLTALIDGLSSRIIAIRDSL
jgi:hypothetical protein